MDQVDLLRHLIAVLERLDVPYMLVGSLASAAYGEPRMTQDIDVVVDLGEQQVGALCRAFASGEYYVSESAALDALRRRTQFNIIHVGSGTKIDLVILPVGPWGKAEFARRQRMQILPDLEGYCARPEDIILSKMEHYREGGSEKHLRDIMGILKVSGDAVDRSYVTRWADGMGLADIWQAILARLGR